MSDIYREPIVEKLIELLEAGGPSRLKGRYINGDVQLPDKSELPLCYIAKDVTRAGVADNMTDAHRMAFAATLILDFTDDFNGLSDIVAGSPDMYEMVEGRDGTTYYLKDDTLLYQLSKNISIGDHLWLNQGSDEVLVNYGLGIEKRGPGIFSVEATIRFTALLHQPRPGQYA